MKPVIPPFIAIASVLLIATVFFLLQPRGSDEELPTWPTVVPAGKIDFKKNVRPLLIINCFECHNNEDAPKNGNLSLETRKLAMTTGVHPPVIVPGKPDESLLITVLTLDGIHKEAMPPTPDKIWGVRMEILRRWIQEGADWPENIPLVHPSEIKEW
tara:strand:+ start:52 stop:522 length:471 start_codon:yes stop_codon:yes gene_type:complete